MTVQSTIHEIINDPRVQNFKPFILSNCMVPDTGWTLQEMNEHFYDWGAEDIALGWSRMEQLLKDGRQVAFDIYSHKEKEENPEKQNTKLFFFPGQKEKPFLLILPGGGYGAVCNLKEGFPVAAKFNEWGYNAFVLSYRVRSFQERDGSALLPGPMEDVAASLRFILQHEQEFSVTLKNYAVAGFSSGGHLAGEWGTNNVGAPKYDLPKPSCVILGYGAIDTTLYREFRGKNLLMAGMCGDNFAEKDVHWYNVNEHVEADYPATFLWHCIDDEIIPVETSRRMAALLKEKQIPVQYLEVKHGGHGFGLGQFTEARHWARKAALFWETAMQP